MARPHKPKKPKPPNKKLLVSKFVTVPNESRREFWQREFVLLNRLAERYSLEFLRDTTFLFQGESLAILFAPKILQDLDKRFRIYLSPPRIVEREEIVLQEDESVKRQLPKRKPKTIKDFLDG
jgi:hypothetical protein